MTLQIDILYTPDCTDWEHTADLIEEALDELDLAAEIQYWLIESDRQAMEYNFIGSPTVRFNGEDPWLIPNAPAGMRLRPYFTPEGMLEHPTYDMIYEYLSQFAE